MKKLIDSIKAQMSTEVFPLISEAGKALVSYDTQVALYEQAKEALASAKAAMRDNYKAAWKAYKSITGCKADAQAVNAFHKAIKATFIEATGYAEGTARNKLKDLRVSAGLARNEAKTKGKTKTKTKGKDKGKTDKGTEPQPEKIAVTPESVSGIVAGWSKTEKIEFFVLLLERDKLADTCYIEAYSRIEGKAEKKTDKRKTA